MNKKIKHVSWIVTSLLIVLCLPCIFGCKSKRVYRSTDGRLVLKVEYDRKTGLKKSIGTYKVWEDRHAGKGRMLELDILVLHAEDTKPASDPIFILRGGPGVPAVDYYQQTAAPWMLHRRDIVLVNQRGTGGSNKLYCKLPGSDDNLQGYLDPIFDIQSFRVCLEELKKKADLTMYSTYAAMDDLNEVRMALGYDKINLIGYSYGTRAALVYMRLHPETVRTAILIGVAPVAFKNPLYHASSAQQAIERLFAECAADPDCNAVFPDLEKKLNIILDRLEREPIDVSIAHPVTKKPVQVKLTRNAFAEALRVMLYSTRTNRRVPLLIHKAFAGAYNPFTRLGVEGNRRLRNLIRFGQLLCVTCAEDVARIKPDEILRETRGTFLGDGRVRRQIAVCDFWPKSILPSDFGEPIRADVPVLLLTGTLDPVTPPGWGAEAASHLPNSLHLAAPGAHDLGGPCIEAIMEKFLDAGSVKSLDISCIEKMKLPPFKLLRK
jgi:pimeloyl-ACP methyl ester carboxylesterase